METAEKESQPVPPLDAASSEHAIHVFTSKEPLNLTQSSKLHVRSTDFGADGFHPQPYALRAPEVILGFAWGTSADIWNLGCLIFEFLTGSLVHMPAMALETFDHAYFGTAKNFGEYSYDDGELRINDQEVRALEKALANYGVICDDEMSTCISFLHSMLRLKPSHRASAAKLMEHDWLKV